MISLEHAEMPIVEKYNQVLSQENLGVTAFSPGQPMMKRLREMFHGTKDFVLNAFAKAEEVEVKQIVDMKKLIDIAENQNYAAMGNIPVSNPLRLTRPWTEYVQALIKLQEVTQDIDKNLLQPFNDYIGRGLNDPQLFATMTFEPKGYKVVPTEPLKRELSKFLNGPNKEKAPWKQAFKRNGDVRIFSEQLNKLLTLHASLSPQTVHKSLDVLIANCTALLDEVETPTSKYVLTKKSTQRIADLILETARHVELFTITHQLIAELQQCAEETVEAINFG